VILFIDESGLSERPTRVRTWAPKGQTPVIEFHFNWTHISAIAALSPTNCVFQRHEDSIKKGIARRVPQGHAWAFQAAPADHLGRPEGAHSKLVREYIDATDGDLQMAFLPSYSPDLNPAEFLWACLKRHALANFCPDNLNDLNVAARNKLKSARHRSSIIRACWKHAGL